MAVIRPDLTGPKSLFLNPSVVSFTTAEIAAIDSAITGAGLADFYPYAYTATVGDSYDAMNGYIIAQDIAVNSRVCFGVFLSADNDKGNLLHQVMGSIELYAGSGGTLTTGFFFGRKATNNTVVSSKAAASNLLDKFVILPPDNGSHATFTGVGHRSSVRQEVFSLVNTSGYVYCFGVYIQNNSGATVSTVYTNFSLAMRKFGSELSVYDPRG